MLIYVKKNTFIEYKPNKHKRMLFIIIAWSLVLLTFAIWLRALHSIPIYTHTPLQEQEQALQLQTVSSITQMLLALAVACIGLHFMLPGDVMRAQTSQISQTAVNASAMAHAHNFTA
jgi:hypothetical protein